MGVGVLISLLLGVHPPPFESAWVDPSVRWDVPAGDGPAIAVGALIGGWIGDVHPAWLVATAAVETGYTFKARARGDNGRSLGLCQIQLRTSRQSLPWMTRELLLDPVANLIAAGAHYDRLITKYGRELAQARYGCGFLCNGPTKGAKTKAIVFKQLTGRAP